MILAVLARHLLRRFLLIALSVCRAVEHEEGLRRISGGDVVPFGSFPSLYETISGMLEITGLLYVEPRLLIALASRGYIDAYNLWLVSNHSRGIPFRGEDNQQLRARIQSRHKA